MDLCSKRDLDIINPFKRYFNFLVLSYISQPGPPNITLFAANTNNM